ncbi:hypothetical protein D3C71_1836420 [compost metagenome]
MNRFSYSSCELLTLPAWEQIIIIAHVLNVEHKVHIDIGVNDEFLTFALLPLTVLRFLCNVIDMVLGSYCPHLQL